MRRRQFTWLVWTPGWAGPAVAAPAFSDLDAGNAVRAALVRGAQAAVGALGRPDGFLANPRVTIPFPPWLERSASWLRNLGQGARLDQLHTSMNRAAEAAVPQALGLLVDAVKTLTVQDAKALLGGGDDAVTRFFAARTREPLGQKFLPIVTRATERLSLAQRYNALAGKAVSFGLVAPGEATNLQQFVTERALDGLFLVIGEQEREIRRDPVATGSALLRQVFGALK